MPVYADLTAAQADGVVHYVPFNEGSGVNVEDYIVDGNGSLDSIISNDVDNSSVIPGKFDFARDFAAQGGTVNLQNAGALDTTNFNTWTVSFWYKCSETPPATTAIFQMVGLTGISLIIKQQTDGDLEIDFAGVGVFPNNTPVNDGAWHWIMIRHDGGQCAVWIDRSFEAGAASSANLYPAYTFSIGLATNLGFQIDDLGVWNKALPIATIDAIWVSGSGDVLVDLPVFAQVGIEVDVFDASLVNAEWTIQIDVEQRVVSAKTFVEIVKFEKVSAAVGIEVQVSAPVASAEVGLEVEVFSVVAPNVAIEVQKYDVNSPSRSVIWKPVVTIGGVAMSDRLTDSLSIKYDKNASAIASLVTVPESGPIDVFAYVGQLVTIDEVEVDILGNEYQRIRVYTGVVDKPSYDPDKVKINFSCTNDIQGRVAGMTRAEIDTLLGGLWSPVIFDENASNWNYFNDQLSTLEGDAWIDASGIFRRTGWDTSVVDYQYNEDSRIYDTIRILNPDKGDIINRINIAMDFRYMRFIQRNVFYEYGGAGTLCHFLDGNTFPLPLRSMIESAADGAGWVRMGAIAYKPVWEPQNSSATGTNPGAWQDTNTVYCGGQTYGWYGEPDKEDPKFCIGASFTLCKRWEKTLNEVYRFTVEAPESIQANGVRYANESYGLQAEAPDDWETNYTPLEVVRDIPGNTTTVGLPLVMPPGSVELSNGDWMFPAEEAEGTGRTTFNEAQTVAMTKARVEILDGHRSRDVTFDIPLDPLMDLAKVVRLNTTRVQATGVVRTVRHVMDIATGRAVTTVTLASSGSGTAGIITDDPIAPIEAVDNLPLTEYDKYVWLPTRLGGRLSSVPYENDGPWDGYTANYEYDPDDNSRPDPFSPFDAYSSAPDVPAYPRQFSVSTPDISEGDRQADNIEADTTIQVNIPIDELNEVA